MSLYIVTGAAGNLGSAVVNKLLDEGQQVVGILSPGHREIPEKQGNRIAFAVDASDENQVDACVGNILKKYGPVRGLIATIGGFAAGSIEKTGLEQVQKMMKLNFHTAYAFARPLLQAMKQQEGGGRMVFIGTRPALDAAEGHNMVAYAFSKSLVFQLAACINAGSRESGVTAAVLVPGTIDTDANRKSMPHADFSSWVQPDELARMAWMLVSGRFPSLREPVIKMYGNS